MTVHAAGELTESAESFVTRLEAAIIFPLMALLSAVALLVFLWGAFQYVANAGSDDERTKGKRHMLYGVIGLLVMLSAYTILRIAANTFGVSV
ncbi:hypothetical protein KC727_02820 [Candidatus Kaiserbacteria bacterium]|nr:hypothetical protein [Candidatus Kaiserbacteria bacterium]